MRRTTGRTLGAWRAAFAALLMALLATGAAQSTTPADESSAFSYTYDIIQFGQTLGQTSMNVERGAEGYRTASAVSVAGLFQAENRMEARPDGSALSYTIEGTTQGVAFRIDVAFTDAGADLTLSQGGATQSLSVPSEAPLYVVDNNFLEGFQLAADQVMASGQPQTFAALVPQTAALVSLAFDAPQPGSVDYLGEATEATLIEVLFSVAGQELTLSIYLDDSGHILVLEQQPGAVRFVRQPADDAQPGGDADEEEGAAPRGNDEAADQAAGSLPTATEEQAPIGGPEALQANAACLVEREVSVSSTGETLYGRLTLPLAATAEGALPAPTLLILPGSGAPDMDGNVAPFITNAMYKQLAYELACHGYGALRVAKLGMPPSTGDGNAVTLATYAENTADWLAFLAEQPGVDAQRLGIIGHSEGGLVALFAAADGYADPQVVVTVAAPGRPLDAILREQLLASFERSGITGQAYDDLVAQTDAALEAVRGVEGPTLELEGELAENQIAASFAHAAGLLRSEFEQDPAELAGQLQVPVLVVQGLKDIQVQQDDAHLLAGPLQRGTLLEFPDMGHNLNHVPGDPEAGAFPAADALIYQPFVRSLVTWLDGYLRVAR